MRNLKKSCENRRISSIIKKSYWVAYNQFLGFRGKLQGCVCGQMLDGVPFNASPDEAVAIVTAVPLLLHAAFATVICLMCDAHGHQLTMFANLSYKCCMCKEILRNPRISQEILGFPRKFIGNPRIS